LELLSIEPSLLVAALFAKNSLQKSSFIFGMS
jgi:hypothetical protein